MFGQKKFKKAFFSIKIRVTFIPGDGLTVCYQQSSAEIVRIITVLKVFPERVSTLLQAFRLIVLIGILAGVGFLCPGGATANNSVPTEFKTKSSLSETLGSEFSKNNPLTLNATHVDVLCFGGATGSIDLTITGEVLPMTISWTGPSGFNATSEDISGLIAGDYTVTVTDASGPQTLLVSITQPTAALTASITSQTDVLCFGNATGSVTVAGANGTGPYQYSLNGGAYQASGTFSALAAGSYTVTVRDANLCTVNQAVTITQPTAALTASITSQTDVLCFGNATGSVTVAGANGTGPYQYSLNGGAYQASGTFSALAAGSYTVTVRDANLCTVNQAVTITQPTAALTASITSQTDVLCFGNATGSVTVAGANGTGPYQYSLNGGAYQASGTFSALAAGSYTVTVRDANLCTVNQAVTITQPTAALTASITSQTDVLCFGNATGSVTVAGANGTGPYQYSLNGGAYQASGTFSALAAGSYTVTVRDANLCTINQAVTITQPTAALTASITSQTDVLCFGNATGSVTVAGANGTGPYQYSLNGGAYQASGTFSALVAGSYTVTVRDANLCTVNQAVTITQPTAALTASITSQTDVLCFGNATGSVTVAGANGTGPYQYSLNGGAYQASGTFSALVAGSYTVTVRDANLCTVNQAVTITQPTAALTASITSQTDVLCFGNATGSVTVAGANGTGPYQYSLNGGAYQASGTFSALAAGSYTVTVRDANLCTVNQAVTITQPTAALTASITSQTDVLCFGNATGSVTVAGANGTGPYQYSLNGGAYQASGTFSALAAGSYTVTVRDANLCTVNQAVTINQPVAALVASESHTIIACSGGTSTVSLTASGGTAPYSGIGTFTQSVGSVTYTVTDNNGCTSSVTIILTEPSVLTVTGISSNSPVCEGGALNLTLTVSGGTGPNTFAWTGPNGFTSTDQNPSIAGVTTSASGAYTVIVTDANGCTVSANTSATVNPNPVITASIDYQAICPGQAITPINLTSTIGGTTYTWMRDNTGVLTGMPASGTGNSITGTLTSSDPQLSEITTFTITGTTPDGCATTITVAVEVYDNTDPIITCPVNITVNADANQCTASGVALGTPIVTDQCDVTVTNNALAVYPIGVTNITWTALDAAGNNASCTQTVTVIDNQLPTISCPADLNVSTNSGCTAINVILGTPTVNDNCGVPAVSNNAPVSYPLGVTTVTWIVTDGSGNAATCDQTVTVTDDTPPTITCPANVTVSTDLLCFATGVNLGTPMGSDNCGVPTFSNDAPAQFPLGVTTVTWTATDASGNSSNCIQIVTVTDSENPTISCPSDVLVSADANLCSASGVSLGTPNTGDNCGVASVLSDAPATFPVGTTVVTWTVTDNSGNKATCMQNVVVEDNQNPTISCPPIINKNADAGLCTASAVGLGIPLTNDNCGVLDVTNDAPAIFPVGSTTVTYIVRDIHGNTAQCNQLVVVTDNENPTIFCPADITVSADANSCDATGVSLGAPTVGDNCGVATTNNDAPVTFPLGVTTVTWTVTDINGRTATCEQDVTIVDNEPPTISCQAGIVVSADANACEATGVTLGAPVTDDNCGVATVTSDAPGAFPLGTTTVTWTVIDNGGLSATCIQTVTVIDDTPPVPDLDPLPDVHGDVCGVTNVNPPVATDNCGTITATTSDPTSFTLIGTYTINWLYTDANGNTLTQIQNVIITNNGDPIPNIANLPTIREQCSATVSVIPGALSSCLIPIVGTTSDPLTYNSQGNYVITWTYDDGLGRSNTQTQSVIIEDTIDPVITCPTDITQPADSGSCNATVTIPIASCNDNCGCAGITNDYTAGGADASGTYPLGSTIVTFIATDNVGNTSTCSITVTVTDNEIPAITCPSDISVSSDPVNCNAFVAVPLATFTDNCAGGSITNSFNGGGANASGTYPVGTTTVTFTATDAAGNKSTCEVNITVVDNTPPTADPLSDLGPYQCYSAIPAPDINYLTNVSGNCGPVTVTHLSTGPNPGCSGTVVRIYRLTAFNGMTADIPQNIIILDNTAPTANALPQLGPYSCYANIPAADINVVTGETDNCGGVVTVTYLGTDPDPGCTGTLARRYQIADGCGNSAILTQQIVINDQTGPVLSGIPLNALVACSAVPPPPATVTATDDCDSSPTIIFTETSTKTNFGLCTDFAYTLTRTWTASDDCGHSTSGSQTITVVDNVAPTITVPANSTYECSQNLDPSVIGYPILSDLCDPNPTMSYVDTPISIGCANELSITRKWTAIDACGNTRTADQYISVVDNTPPTFVNFPANINVSCPDDIPEILSSISATDNCGTATVTLLSESYQGLENKPGFCPTGVIRIYRAMDGCGNHFDQTQIITVAGECGCSICQSSVPHELVDLRNNPDSIWISEEFKRGGLCCDALGNSECASFTIYLHPNVVSIIVQDVKAPSYGSEYYQIDCSTAATFGTEICIYGGGVHVITICKPGKEKQQISITQMSGIMSPAEIDSRVDCQQDAVITGNVDESSVTWRDITGGGLYNRYLECLSGCLTNHFTPDSLAPSIVQYEVCGSIAGSICLDGAAICDTVTFRVFPAIGLAVDGDPDFCVDDPHMLTLTPTPLGTYTIRLYDGPGGTGNLISTTVGPSLTFWPTTSGTYSVYVTENYTGLECNERYIDFEVNAYPLPVFDLGPDISLCYGDTISSAWIDPPQSSHAHLVDLPDEYTYNWLNTNGVVVGNDPSVFIISPPIGSNTYTVIATSQYGCTTEQELTVTVSDCLDCPPPQTVCPGEDVVINTVSEFVAMGGDITGYPCNVSDNNILLYSTVSDNLACPETLTMTFEIWDDCGNYDVCELTVIRDDVVAPVVSAPTPINLESCDAADINNALISGSSDLVYSTTPVTITLAQLNAEGITATDDCNINSITYQDSSDGLTCPVTVTRTFTVTDDCTNSTVVTQLITIDDNTGPTFTVPADITVSKDADCSYDASVSITGDVTDEADNCDNTLDATYSDDVNPGTCEGQVIITRTWTLVDDCGNTTIQVQTITAADNLLGPTFTAPANITISKDALCNYDASVAITGDVTDEDDNCDTSLNATFLDDVAPGTCEGQVIITRTWSLTDDCGLTTSHVQIITVSDNVLAPTFTAPANITISKDALCNYDASVAITGDVTDEDDNCDTSLNATFLDDVAPGTCEGQVIITRTWSLTDDCGLTTSHIQIITVADNVLAPTFTAPANITISKDALCNYDASVAITGDVTDEADNCDTSLNATFLDDVAPGACEGQVIITRTWFHRPEPDLRCRRLRR